MVVGAKRDGMLYRMFIQQTLFIQNIFRLFGDNALSSLEKSAPGDQIHEALAPKLRCNLSICFLTKTYC